MGCRVQNFSSMNCWQLTKCWFLSCQNTSYIYKHLNRFRSLVCFAQVSSSSMCDGVFVWWPFCAIERVFSGQLSDFWGVWSSPIHFSREIHRCYWLTVFCLGLNTGSCKMSKIEEQIVAFDSPSEIHSWNINSTSKNTTKKKHQKFQNLNVKKWTWSNSFLSQSFTSRLHTSGPSSEVPCLKKCCVKS